MHDRGPSLFWRTALAVALTVGFYALALAIAGALIALPVVGLVDDGVPFNVWLAIFMVVTGVTILRAIVPRRHRFEPPGPEIAEADQPELVREVRAVSEELGEPLPHGIYVAHDVNAAVTEERRVLGPSRRFLIVGLPLLDTLSPAELRAVIAHEYGHYVGGDTRVGPWIWRTRLAIGRTLAELHDEESIGRRLVQLPFEWYGRLFMRITSAVSRRQELAADRVAAQVAGPEAQASALRRIHVAAPAFDAYFADEVVPLLQAGRRPPLAAGFSRFMAAEGVREAARRHTEALSEAKSDPYDSHPSLPERLAALGFDSTDGDAPAAGEPASRLLRDRDGLERRLLETLFGAEAVRELRPIDWDEVGAEVVRRNYEQLVRDFGAAFAGAAIRDAPDALRDPEQAAARVRQVDGEVPAEAAPGVALATVAAATALALADRGWRIEALPGEPVLCRRGDAVLAPFADVEEVAGGRLDAAGWRERYAEVADAPIAAETAEREPARS
jgi:heat shock protein HtpX